MLLLHNALRLVYGMVSDWATVLHQTIAPGVN